MTDCAECRAEQLVNAQRELLDGMRRRLEFAIGHHSDNPQWWENHARQTLRWLDAFEQRAEKGTQGKGPGFND